MLQFHLTCLNPNQLDFDPDSTMGVRKASHSSLQRHRPLLAPHPVGLGLVDVEYPEERDRDLAFIKDEGNVLADATAPWFATFFLAAAKIKLGIQEGSLARRIAASAIVVHATSEG